MKDLIRSVQMLGWLLAGFLLVAPSAAQQHLRAPDEAIPKTLWGLHIHRLGQEPWPDVTFGSLRLWDAHVMWWDMEPQKSKFLFGGLDKQVSEAQSHGVDVLMTLAMTPTWASSRPYDSAKLRPGAVAEPKNNQDWQDFVKAVATRYKGRIHYWEIWNEPNDQAFYSGSIEKLVEVERIAYETLKEVDPSNMVTSPPPTYALKGVPWLDNFLRAGGGKYADIIGYHMYVTEPEDLVPLVQQIRAVMNKNGVGSKPLWNTETGWELHNKLSPVQGEGIVSRSYILSWALDVPRFYWYDWDSNTEGLAEKDGAGRIPAGYSYIEIQRWLLGARMSGCDSSGNTWTCQITRDGGYHGYIVWDSQGSQNFSIPASWKVVSQHDIDSHTHPMKNVDKTQISIRPILLENVETKFP